MKVILVSVDGMRPDSMKKSRLAQELISRSSYTLSARTVFPSVTLPCHMSMFHSVDPERHGITTNIYTPQVRPINGLIEQLQANGNSCAFFYNWEELRDLTRPGHLDYSFFFSGHTKGDYALANKEITREFLKYYPKYRPDFTFLYYGEVDSVGHDRGWMSKEYIAAVQSSWREISKDIAMLDSLGEEYTLIVTADHGGHGRIHGTMEEEDMTIPIIAYGPSFEAGRILENANIKDIPATIAALLGARPAREWEGRILYE